MKEVALFLALGGIATAASAQTTVKLNVVLHDVQHLAINPDQSTVTLAYHILDDYQNGVESVQKRHLSIFSTSSYEVKVKLANQAFVRLDGEQVNAFPVPPIRVKARAVNAHVSKKMEANPLSTREEVLIASDSPTFDALFDVSYHGPGANELINYVEKNKSVTFTNDVLYSIETK